MPMTPVSDAHWSLWLCYAGDASVYTDEARPPVSQQTGLSTVSHRSCRKVGREDLSRCQGLVSQLSLTRGNWDRTGTRRLDVWTKAPKDWSQ